MSSELRVSRKEGKFQYVRFRENVTFLSSTNQFRELLISCSFDFFFFTIARAILRVREFCGRAR